MRFDYLSVPNEGKLAHGVRGGAVRGGIALGEGGAPAGDVGPRLRDVASGDVHDLKHIRIVFKIALIACLNFFFPFHV